MKSGFYMTTSSVVGPRRNSQNTSQSQTCTEKKVILIVWWSAAYLINYSFLNPSKAIISEKYAQQIDEMHWKLQHLQLALVNRMGPILLHSITWPHVTQPKLQKLNVLGYVASFASSIIFTWPLANLGLPLLQASQQLSPGKMLPQPSGSRKCFPRVYLIPKHRFLHNRNKKTCWQKCVDCNGSYFD